MKRWQGVILAGLLCGVASNGWRACAWSASTPETISDSATPQPQPTDTALVQQAAQESTVQANAAHEAQQLAERESALRAPSTRATERAAERAMTKQLRVEHEHSVRAAAAAQTRAHQATTAQVKAVRATTTAEQRVADHFDTRARRAAARDARQQALEADAAEDQQHIERHLEVLGFQLSGNITTLAGWQRNDKASSNAGTRPRGLLGDQLADVGVAPNSSIFGFFIDQFELDVERQFKDIAAMRVDVDISPHRDANGNGTNSDIRDIIDLEQAYVTITPSALLDVTLGRFNAGFGLDPVDRWELPAMSFNSIHRFLVPNTLTGLRLGFSDEAWNAELFAVQGINNQDLNQKTVVPTLGTRLEWIWGDAPRPSRVWLSVAAGPQATDRSAWTVVADASAEFAVGSAVRLGVEGVYRREFKQTCGDGSSHCSYFGGVVQATLPLGERFNLAARGGYLRDANNGPRTGASESIIDGTVTVNYAPMRQVRTGLEYRYELARFHGALATRLSTQTHGIGLLASYAF